MNELGDLYQDIILDHNRNPRNFRAMEDADAKLEGYNPLCGDHFTLYVKFDGDKVADASFDGAGCAISKASASIMSDAVKGKSREEVRRLFELFHSVVTGRDTSEESVQKLGKLAAFSGVSEYPARVKCATLAWHTVLAAVNGEIDAVSTEE